jgi:hypothetical protein
MNLNKLLTPEFIRGMNEKDQPGLFTKAWNREHSMFVIPTYDCLLAQPWFVDPDNIVEAVKWQWDKTHKK